MLNKLYIKHRFSMEKISFLFISGGKKLLHWPKFSILSPQKVKWTDPSQLMSPNLVFWLNGRLITRGRDVTSLGFASFSKFFSGSRSRYNRFRCFKKTLLFWKKCCVILFNCCCLFTQLFRTFKERRLWQSVFTRSQLLSYKSHR